LKPPELRVHSWQHMKDWLEQLESGAELAESTLIAAVEWLLDDRVRVADRAEFLIAWSNKGETPGEIATFARELRGRSLQVPLPPDFAASREILDVCGTGGDRLNTFNISTTVALVCSAAGVVVAKHGNRAITSASGSADVLEALGIPINVAPEEAARALVEQGFAFLFAPAFHPAFKRVGPVRRLCAERGQRTIFNFLGPLLNPARPTAQLVGVSRPELTLPLAQSLQSLGVRRAMVVSGSVPLRDGGSAVLDEFSTLGDNLIAEFHQERAIHQSTWSPSCLPLAPATLADLAGGDAAANAKIICGILAGKVIGPARDAVQLNAGAALMLAGRARSMVDGWLLAKSTIDSGEAFRKLESLRRG